jgi:poly-gamma-glutamate synthesis protein (capsule biosynthesis protein)
MKRSVLPIALLVVIATLVPGPPSRRADASVPVFSAAAAPDRAIDYRLSPGGTFFDDDGTSHEGYLEALWALGVISLCDAAADDLVCPDRPVTRSELSTLVARAMCATGKDATCGSDGRGRPDDYRMLIARLDRDCALVGEPTSCLDHAVSRGEAAAMLARILALPPASPATFVDVAESPFAEAIARAESAGLVTPCDFEQRRFCPDAPLTMGEAATLAARAAGAPSLSPPPRPSFVLAATGDILIHTRVTAQAVARGPDADARYDYVPMLARVQDLIASADLALCHLEVPLAPDNQGLTGYPRFRAPREVADALAAVGYDGCSTASNHSIDKGFAGLSDTLDVLDDVGLRHTGTARTEEEASGARLYTVGPAVVGHLSYTYGMNGLRPPRDAVWSVNRIDAAAILAEADRVRAAGADFVVVSLHWGAEYTISPTRSQRKLADELLASDSIDLLVGHHAHVVQPLGRVGDKYVAYGLGNFLSGQCCNPPNTRDGVIAFFEIARRGDDWVVRKVEFTPTWVNRYGSYHVYSIPDALENPDISDSFKRTLAASQRRTVASLGQFGEQIVIGAPPPAVTTRQVAGVDAP